LWTHATFASLYMAETLFVFLLTGGFLCLTLAYQQRMASDATQSDWRWLVTAGMLLGLAILTRSVAWLFLPVIALWLVFQLPTRQATAIPDRQTLLRNTGLALLFVVSAVVIIAPWTTRNYLAYGDFILVETGLSYNLWAFSEPHEDSATIFRTLESIPNPAERSDFASAKGMERLQEDPAIMIRKLWPNWVYLWRVKPIQDRFLQEFYYADVEFPLFVAALVFDDLLYLLIALAAFAGLVWYRPKARNPFAHSRPPPVHRVIAQLQHPKWLCVGWVLYVVAIILLTHGEARYRHILFPVLIPFAAWVLTSHREILARYAPARSYTAWIAPLLILAIWTPYLWTVFPSYPWEWARQNITRGWHIQVGDLAQATGNHTAAMHAYQRAVAADPTPDGWLRIGDLARSLGETQQAIDAYEEAIDLEPLYIASSTRLGDLLRATGDEDGAREAFAGFYADAQQITNWAWRELAAAPPSFVDVGDGLDFGYVRGVYPAEELQGTKARWTDGKALILVQSDPTSAFMRVQLRLAAPRPDEQPVPTDICLAHTCYMITPTATWRTYSLLFETPASEATTIAIESATFNAADGRQLGVLVDWGSAEGMAERS
ncbi:MAG: tetratricopeptide repeat protein, partial [Chloroflexota bacterium]